MKKAMCFWLVALLVAALLVGCGETGTHTPTQAPTTPNETVEASQPAETIEETTPAEQLPEADVDPAYAQQIGDFYATLSQEEQATVGFGYVDLDQDGQNELVIGEISEEDLLSVREIWTIVKDAPVLVAKSDDQNRYGLQYMTEDMAWYVVREVGGTATYYLMLAEGELSVAQGIICVTADGQEAKWYMTYDLDGDISNDDPADEATAKSILEINRKHYVAAEYQLYTMYR